MSTSTFWYAYAVENGHNADKMPESISNVADTEKLAQDKTSLETKDENKDVTGENIDSQISTKSDSPNGDNAENMPNVKANSSTQLEESSFDEESSLNQTSTTDEENIEDGKFKIALHWAGTSNPDYKWDAKKSEKKVIKLTFYYENEVTSKAYKKGELKVTITGIGKLNRDETIKALDVAADVSGTADTKRDWSYTYNASNDTYTFTNNHDIEMGASFNGSFEMLWEFNSRSCVNGYMQDVKATLTDGEEQVESKKLTLNFTSEKDTYKIEKTAKSITSADGLSKYVEDGKTTADYAWVQYTFKYYTNQTNARSLQSRYFIDTLPEGCV